MYAAPMVVAAGLVRAHWPVTLIDGVVTADSSELAHEDKPRRAVSTNAPVSARFAVVFIVCSLVE
jgi:hypothetical protein